LSGVGRGEVEARVHQRGIEVLGLLEILDGLIELSVPIGGDALIEQVARLEFVAAAGAESGDKRGGNQQRNGLYIFGVPEMHKRIHGKQSIPAIILCSPRGQ